MRPRARGKARKVCVMTKLRTSTLLAAAVILGSAAGASAADLPIIEEPVPVPVVHSGWYLRGDIGVSVSKDMALHHADVTAAGGSFIAASGDTSAFAGIGLGYSFNRWARVDLTGEFRTSMNFKATDEYRFDCDAAGLTGVGSCGTGGTITRNNMWMGSIDSWVVMLNGYADFGDVFYGISPFVGAGIGFAHHRIHGVGDFDPSDLGGGGIASENSDWDFAWALHAGLAYDVNERLTLEVAYRYLDMGEIASGSLCSLPSCFATGAALEVKDMTSHDIKMGMRWNFASGGGYHHGGY